MLAISATYRIHVSVVRSGHPLHVFGTDRLSDHPQGRAFDTWAIDGHPVVDAATPRSLIEGYIRAAASAGRLLQAAWGGPSRRRAAVVQRPDPPRPRARRLRHLRAT